MKGNGKGKAPNGNKNLPVLLLCFFFGAAGVYGLPDVKKVLIVPFENRDEKKYDYLKELIPNSFIDNLSDSGDFLAVPLVRYYALLKDTGREAGEHRNIDALIAAGAALDADYIIRGGYSVAADFISIDFEVFDIVQHKIIYKREDYGKGGLSMFETLDELIEVMKNDFIEVTSGYVSYSIEAEGPCILYIDDRYVGKTPAEIYLSAGRHGLKAVCDGGNEEYTVYDGPIYAGETERNRLFLKVFVRCELNAEVESHVYINGQPAGKTPFTGTLYAGNTYRIKLTTTDRAGKEVAVAEETISTVTGEDILRNFKVTGTIELAGVNGAIKGRIENGTGYVLPHLFEHLLPGDYGVEFFLDVPDANRTFVFHGEHLYLNPADNKIVDIGSKAYKPIWPLCFVPAAAQFHNQEPRKGLIVLSSFLVFLIAGCGSFYCEEYFYSEYVGLQNAGRDNLAGSAYATMEVFQALKLFAFIISGGVYLYSFCDGLAGMNELDRRINSGKP
ncbi:MAG: hypothetical protein JW881_20630 [Spirochaetales bacterium]|nr:hypothetical protein [Spirochaetales bacterium]